MDAGFITRGGTVGERGGVGGKVPTGKVVSLSLNKIKNLPMLTSSQFAHPYGKPTVPATVCILYYS